MKKKIALFLSKIFITYYKLRYGGRVRFGDNVIVNHKFKLSGKGKIIIGDNVNLWAHAESNSFYFYEDGAKVIVGEGSRLNGVTCQCAEKIEIGKRCLVGSAIIMDTDFHSFDDPNHILFGNDKIKAVKIGDDVWLAGQCVLLKGVAIGNKSVVGFRAVVTKSFPDNVVVAGNPARVVKKKN